MSNESTRTHAADSATNATSSAAAATGTTGTGTAAGTVTGTAANAAPTINEHGRALRAQALRIAALAAEKFTAALRINRADAAAWCNIGFLHDAVFGRPVEAKHAYLGMRTVAACARSQLY